MHLPRLRAQAGLLGLALLTVTLIGAACAPAAPSPGGTPTQPVTPAAVGPVRTGAGTSAPQVSQDPGPSAAKSPAAAKTHHYKGDPNAPIVVIEISDFQ